VADWTTVCELALALPDVVEVQGQRPSLQVHGKSFAWIARERDGGGLAVRVEREEKELILDANPDVYFTSPHYRGFPAVQIKLDKIDRDELAQRIEDAWLIQAPKRLAGEFLAS
jgi:hypothetical protein